MEPYTNRSDVPALHPIQLQGSSELAEYKDSESVVNDGDRDDSSSEVRTIVSGWSDATTCVLFEKRHEVASRSSIPMVLPTRATEHLPTAHPLLPREKSNLPQQEDSGLSLQSREERDTSNDIANSSLGQLSEDEDEPSDEATTVPKSTSSSSSRSAPTQELHINPDDPNQEQILKKLSRHINMKWSLLARYCGTPEEEIVELKKKVTQSMDRAYAILCRVARKGITWNQLYKFLLNKFQLPIAASVVAEFANFSHESNPATRLCPVLINLEDRSHVELLMEICKSVSEHWKQLAGHVGYETCNTKYSVHQIAYNCGDNVECCNEMLIEWIVARVKDGNPPSFGELLVGVEATQFDPCLIDIMRKFYTR